MSIFTTISRQQLEQYITNYNLGTLREYSGIEAGVTNSNYYIVTSQKNYILTIFEDNSASEIKDLLKLTAYLAQMGLPCAKAITDKQHKILQTFKDKPSAIITYLPGASIDKTTIAHCRAIGNFLGQLHTHSQNYHQHLPNSRNNTWRDAAIEKLMPIITKAQQAVLHKTQRLLDNIDEASLPKGIIHADLFRDNVLFEGTTITGVIDFYYACYDSLLYDLAITVNDWCQIAQGQYAQDKITALLDAYQAIRPLTEYEKNIWPLMRHQAAMRFWLSRLLDFHFPPPGDKVLTKDPDEYFSILCNLTTKSLSPL